MIWITKVTFVIKERKAPKKSSKDTLTFKETLAEKNFRKNKNFELKTW